MGDMRAFMIEDTGGPIRGRMIDVHTDALVAESPSVLIESHYSSIGYKDALAATGRGKILRTFPLIGGQDVSGCVVASEDPRLRPGDEVVVTGYGLGETHHGGLAEYVRVPASWPVVLPTGLSLFEAMALGTAGFTAAQAMSMMEHNRQTPEMGPIVVTGATGGVGSVAINILHQLGYEVIAVTSRPGHRAYLEGLGASSVCSLEALELGERLLGKGRFGGVVDNLGGETLQRLLPHVRPGGNVACIGLAQGVTFGTSVMPFIIRGVNLLGINSTYCRRDLREQVWQRLAQDMKPRDLERIVSRVIELDAMDEHFVALLERRAHGRMVVSCRGRVTES